MKTFLSLLFLCSLTAPAPAQETDAQSNEEDSSGSVSGNGTVDISKTGSGTLVLENPNWYSGGTGIIGGELQLGEEIDLNGIDWSDSGLILENPYGIVPLSSLDVTFYIDGQEWTFYSSEHSENIVSNSLLIISGFQVTFDPSSHGITSDEISLNQFVPEDSTAREPTLSVDPGWIFNGWTSEPSGIATNQITENVTFTATYQADSDLDGWSDENETLMGTNPENAQDHFQHQIRWENGQVKIDYFPHNPNCLYEVQWTDDLSDPDSWQTLPRASFQSHENRRTASLTPNNGSDTNFYRIRIRGSE
ncbi:autotransporter-associated beta strand repeat-containing protein [Puniceicoccus vermicola]|uniref:Autotransporter-associated beta strand repeat-containing protein n=1 Tax=Puniceicoccus vermicola TaxID=388746 RepID=A0A7X1E7G9_9BACT|nr:autotransporter-associated beta strand repeat-containing protein [Puniceicoccus vermicola]MBC2603727.1 autotransporter-associated beta strand repeat-containing protein [Puniceicoccus vermicola]